MLQKVVDQVIILSETVAATLTRCERMFQRSLSPTNHLRYDAMREDELLLRLGREWSDGDSGIAAAFRRLGIVAPGDGLHPPRGEGPRTARAEEAYYRRLVDVYERRLARLVLHYLREDRGRGARRPDVLAIAIDLVANAEAPWTRDIVRFVVVLTLRHLYDVHFNIETLHEFRNAYDELGKRFRTQDSRRQLKDDPSISRFLVDLLCIDRKIFRSLGDSENLRLYFTAFSRHPLGVDIERGFRDFGAGDWPQLDGEVPDFASVLTSAFGQPLGIAGLDDALGGLIPTVSGGLITLIAGPPGSGKTSLSVAITSRLAELGSVVSYVATEEDRDSLRAKRISAVQPLSRHLVISAMPSSADVRNDLNARDEPLTWDVVEGATIDSISEVVTAIESDLSELDDEPEDDVDDTGMYVVFPRVVVIDSVSALLNNSSAEGRGGRLELAALLARLRRMSICVFLVTGLDECRESGLEYLVDNVLVVDRIAEPTGRHPLRILDIQKTRLHASNRGVHAFHLSRRSGCSVSPSLHAVLKHLRASPMDTPTRRLAVVAMRRPALPPTQQALPFQARTVSKPSTRMAALRDTLFLRDKSHVVVYGRGSSGKAEFALGLALLPAIFQRDTRQSTSSRLSRNFNMNWTRRDIADASPRRVLVVSFLREPAYYASLMKTAASSKTLSSFCDNAEDALQTIPFYPGYVDPETLVDRVRHALKGARLEGRPYSALIIDGVHNLVLQYPLLEKATLLWPTLFEVIRSEGVLGITTFTNYGIEQPGFDDDAIDIGPERGPVALPADADRLLLQLLVSKCDYAFAVERGPRTKSRNLLRVRAAATLDHSSILDFWWDRRTLAFRRDFGRTEQVRED